MKVGLYSEYWREETSHGNNKDIYYPSILHGIYCAGRDDRVISCLYVITLETCSVV